jgi:hypothetical protein
MVAMPMIMGHMSRAMLERYSTSVWRQSGKPSKPLARSLENAEQSAERDKRLQKSQNW